MTTGSEIKFLRLQVDGETVESYTSKYVETTIHLSDGTHELRAWVENVDDRGAESIIKIGVNEDWDWEEPTPTPSPSPSPTPTP